MDNKEKLSYGNVVTPQGASLLFGKKGNAEYTDIAIENTETWNPYTIIFEEEEEISSIPASSITYAPTGNGNLSSETVQEAISELDKEKTSVNINNWENDSTPSLSEVKEKLAINLVQDEATYNSLKDKGMVKDNEFYFIQGNVKTTPVFSVKTFILDDGATEIIDESGLIKKNPLVFYNGILMVDNINYTITYSANKLTLMDFTAEKDDVMTLVGFAD